MIRDNSFSIAKLEEITPECVYGIFKDSNILIISASVLPLKSSVSFVKPNFQRMMVWCLSGPIEIIVTGQDT